nr:MAG TPA: tail protein [Caudoviricetes sp.]
MELKIYDKANKLRLTASPNTSSSVTEEIGGECSVSASFTHTEYIPLDVDDYIELEGVRYKVKSRYRPKQKNTQTYEYSVKFYAPIHDAEDTLMLFQEGGTTSEFSYDGGPREHLQLWIDNMNRRADANLWSIGTVIVADNKTIDYRNVKCWDAAFGSNGIAATFETEMWADGYVINLCKAERGEMVELGYLQGLTNLAQEDNGEVKFFTRLFPLGSTRNINAAKYGYSRLQLPDRSLYVDKNVDLYGVKEETEETAFSEIFPKYIGTISSVRSEEKENEEGRKYTVYYFKDNGMNWNPKDYEIPDLDYMLKFQTGELAGRGTDGSFQAAWHEDTREWEIINVYPDDTTQIPGGTIIPTPGDQYIPWNFAMPQEYITEAEQEYKQAVDDYLNTYSFDPNKYTGTTDRNYIEKNHTPLHIGWNVRLLSDQYFEAIGGYKDTRITKVQRKLNDLCQATITCSDEVGTGWKSSVDNSLNSLRYEVARQAEQYVYDIIKSFETKTPSDNNVFSALKSLKTLLRKDQSDGTNFLLKFGEFIDSMIAGKGAGIFPDGRGQFSRLEVRDALVVMRLIINEIQTMAGDYAFSDAGCIEKVDDLGESTYKLWMEKRTEFDVTNFVENDVMYSIVNNLLTGGTDYYTSWFRCLTKNVNDNTLTVVLYPDSEVPGGKNYPPVAGYNVTRRGNSVLPDTGEVNERAQSWLLSSREGRIMFLANVYKPILEDYNYAISIGKFPNIAALDKLPVTTEDVGVMAKTIVCERLYQYDYNGDVISNKVDRGEWSLSVAQSEQPYRFIQNEKIYPDGQHTYTELEQHTVYHYGCKWGCLVDKTQDEPVWNSPSWVLLEGDKNYHLDFESSNGWQFFLSQVNTDVTAVVSYGNRDITNVLMATTGVEVEWLRNTGNVPADNSWKPTYVDGKKNTIHLSVSDMGSGWGYEYRRVSFICRVFIPVGEDFETIENRINIKI